MTMKSVDLPHLRSVVLAGHAGAGKTTLAEQLLFKAGAIPRLGKVDDGTAHLDFEPEEQKRRESLSLAVGTFEMDGTRISLVDTPGYPDFVAEVVEGFAAADGALFVMDASAGVEAGLEQAVALARGDQHRGVLLHQQVRPRERRPDRRPGRAARDLRQQDRATPAGHRRGRLVQRLRRPRPSQGVPRGTARRRSRSRSRTTSHDEVARRRDQLLEAASEADDDVLTKYLEGEEIEDHELELCLRKGVKDSVLAPVLVGSAAKGIELRGLLDAFVRYLPSPADEAPAEATDKAGATVEHPGRRERPAPRPRVQDHGRPVRRPADLSARPVRHAPLAGPRLEHDPRRGRAHRPAAPPPRQGAGAHRRAQGRRDRGGRQAGRDRDRRHAGDEGEAASSSPPLDFPAPSLVVAIEPVAKQDLDKMGPALQRMLEEEPTVRLERTATGEQVLVTMGEAHTAVIIERLKRKFGAAIATHTPKVPYKETIRGKTQVHGRYKKQTGGHGMFGDVWIELEPNPDGGIEFAERVVGGSVPRGFFPGVEKGIREAAAEGVLAGYPLSDFKATLYDGSFHPVDSNELSFKIAASMALKDGVHQAKPALLEPIMAVEIRIPDAYMGEVNRDLNGRRGRVLGMDSQDGIQVITAHVPQAELFSYATELRSLAQGRGSFSATPRPLRGRALAPRREGHRRPPQGARGRRARLRPLDRGVRSGRERVRQR